ncbi:hypothetical protein NDU88_004289 [Pleurodeles waltl]|uniref:Uncharacterized protein n=1 Tax=Pleurodeles waltl TaxID=8319 RepID=A0AAV7T9A7_PLEWA|nr:hypothetical protein NDU88_004289 [Pleurodeles waltl]
MDRGMDAPEAEEGVDYTEWSQWSCLCAKGKQTRSREVESVKGMAFLTKTSLKEERPCSHYRCPACQPHDCE